MISRWKGKTSNNIKDPVKNDWLKTITKGISKSIYYWYLYMIDLFK